MSAVGAPKSTRFTRWRHALRELGPAAPWFAVAMVGPLLGSVLVAANVDSWRPWFGTDLGSALLFLFAGAFAAGACLLPTHVTSMVAGFVFGSVAGSLLAFLVALLAAVFGYVLWTPLVGERALRALADSPRGLAVHRVLLGVSTARAVYVIALLRLSPLLPFAATNLLLAAFGVRAKVFLPATMLGITPRVIAGALIGAGLAELDWSAASSPWLTVLAIVATVAAVVVIGRLAARALRQAAALAPRP
jgi:uncharacterized membrane protein YdjX (TVP38/TMEM64 family)